MVMAQFPYQGAGNGSQPFERPFGPGPFGGMTEMANGQTQCFDFPDIGTSLLNAMRFCYFVQAVDDFDGQFAVCGISDVFLLHRRIHMNGVFQCRRTVSINTHPENPVNAFHANTLAKVHQFSAAVG